MERNEPYCHLEAPVATRLVGNPDIIKFTGPMKKITGMLLFGILLYLPLSAQIQAPQFLCVRGDTLFWELPSNNCGPFVAYEVWGSQNEVGPYQLLNSVTNPNQDFYFHPNPGGLQWFFFLRSNYTCPGQVPLTSDTLDNRPPEKSPLLSVSVQGSDVLVTWQPSPSPEVIGYIVYRETAIGVVPIDTVYAGNTYLDTAAAADVQQESYFVNALDACGNTSIFDLKHSTILLEGSLNPCGQSISLSWTPYNNWPAGIGQQTVWAGINGTSPSAALNIGKNDTAFEFPDLNDGDVYCLFIQATAQGTGAVARSNQICLTADIIQAIRDMYVVNVSVNASNQAVVTWAWNQNAEIQEVQVLSSTDSANYNAISVENPPIPLPEEPVFEDVAGQPAAGKIFYKIQTLDDCDSLALSTYGSTIFLEGEPLSTTDNLLQWTEFDIENAEVQSYEVFKSVNGSISSLGTTNVNSRTWEDPVDPTDVSALENCYYIVANAILTAPDGSSRSIKSRSNTLCIEQGLRIFIPNAFAPEGINQKFRPLIVLGNISSYEMRIYDRNGQRLFVSNDPGEGWDGKKGDRKLPQGIYVYSISIVQTDGRPVEKQGTVLLLRRQ
jgi:gliding motility-associated-like protein